MSRENHQPTAPLHPRCSAHWGRAVRAAAAAQPPPGTHSLAQCPGRRRRRGRTRRQRREREKEKNGGERRGQKWHWRRKGRGGKGGEPCAKGPVGEANPQSKVISVQASALESFFPPRSGSGSQEKRSRGPGAGKAEADGERPRWHSLVPPNRWLRKRRRPRRPLGSGAQPRLGRRARTNNLKWQRRPLRLPPFTGTAPNGLRLRTSPASTICAGTEGEKELEAEKFSWLLRRQGRRAGRELMKHF